MMARVESTILLLMALSTLLDEVISSKQNLRLPTSIYPRHYVIELLPLFEAGNWTTLGKVWVHLNCSLPTKEIVFNIKDIEIDQPSIKVTSMAANDIFKIEHQEYDLKSEMYTLKLHKPLAAGSQYRLYVKFKSVLNDLLQGFYRSNYIDLQTGRRRWLAATQFSPTDARRSFPCWDEPTFKSKFTLSIGRPSNLTSLSNMQIVHTSQVDQMPGWYWDHYKTTLPMSTYILGFIVSDMEFISATIEKPDFKFKVWARRDALEQAQYAAHIGPKLLVYLEKYFDIDFPLPKLDMVALPDFGFSGMENWGLITFRESAMLYEERVSSLSQKMNIGKVIGHEIAHQWFGNLVTPAWWDDLWLKEGFATYIGHIALDYVEPGWNVMGQFVLGQLQDVMLVDALKSTHKIASNVLETKDIREKFDSISYEKGASIIRMMGHFMGKEQLQKGLKKYLSSHEFGNAKESQLWEALSDYSDMNVNQVMESWTSQPGYPVLSVIRNYKNSTAQLTQEQFLLSAEKPTSPSNTWWIPVSYTTEDEKDFVRTDPTFWMSDKKKSILMPNTSGNKWILMNINQTGYFRVNYDNRNWELLTRALEEFPETTQAQLLDDAFNLAMSGYIPYAIPLNMTYRLNAIHHYLPWQAAIKNLRKLLAIVTNTHLEQPLKSYILESLPKYNLSLREDKQDMDDTSRLHYIGITTMACHLGEASLTSEAFVILRNWMDGQKVWVPTDLKPITICSGVKQGGEKEWEFIWKKYLAANVGSERDVLLGALGCSNDPAILQKYLNMILDSDSGIRKQDGTIVFASVARNKIGTSIALKFLSEEWDKIQNHFGQAFNRVAKMVTSLSNCLNTDDQLIQLRKLYSEKKSNLGSTEMSFQRTLELVQINVDWWKTHSQQLDKWLETK